MKRKIWSNIHVVKFVLLTARKKSIRQLRPPATSQYPFPLLLSSLSTLKASEGRKNRSEGEQASKQSHLAGNIVPNRKTWEVMVAMIMSVTKSDGCLSEAPLESLSDYLFALSSHVESGYAQDRLLFMLTHIIENTDQIGFRFVAAPTTVKLLAPQSYVTHEFSATTSLKNKIQYSSPSSVFVKFT
ncbi:hypothetical protein Aperf_G00000022263 [Anoplocephala perfoliata]